MTRWIQLCARLIRNIHTLSHAPARSQSTVRRKRSLARAEACEKRLLLAAAFAEFVDPHPAPGNQFGSSVTVLSNGNVVITSPFDDAGGTDAGAVYLYNGSTGALISTLTGSNNQDRIGQTGIHLLSNGNYLIRSSTWNGGLGAVTWGSSVTGVSGIVCASNSLVGSTSGDNIGSAAFFNFANGNYIVQSTKWDNGSNVDAGALTWGNGTTGVSGVVSPANSLVGAEADDKIVFSQIVTLSNGNFLILNPNWDNGAALDAGAVTWGSGTSGVSGLMSAANSLVGTTSFEYVGIGVTLLSNGNYLVRNSNWDNGSAVDAGAVTWGSGTEGVRGSITSSNSLVGTASNDRIGSFVRSLAGGNYLVISSSWDNGSIVDAGAVTWGNGNSGVQGVVSESNSLVGSSTNDQVGNVTVLPNGHYLVHSLNWDNGSAVDAGALTWGSHASGVSGVISASNSLVGSSGSDQIGSHGITTLGGSNYIVRSPNWNNGSAADAGAITWINGDHGVVGAVSSSNSLVGSSTGDQLGANGLVSLTPGNFLISTPGWDNGGAVDAGAVTWLNANTAFAGAISATNSLIGGSSNDQIGVDGITVLPSGNYLVQSLGWDNGPAMNAGAVTWGSATAGVHGLVSATNSLVGSHANDQIGSVTLIGNGNYLVNAPGWDNGTIADAGAVTWGSGLTGISGAVTASNSLVGGSANDQVGYTGLPGTRAGVTTQADGSYLVRSSYWDNETATDAGALTWADSSTALIGLITAENSLIGTSADDWMGYSNIVDLGNGHFLVSNTSYSHGSMINAGAVKWVNSWANLKGTINSANSLIGSRSFDYVGNGRSGSEGIKVLANGNYLVVSPDWDNGSIEDAGAVTWGNGNTGISGEISASNSLVGGSAYNRVGSGGMSGSIKLLNDNEFIVQSPEWTNGSVEIHAMTWGDGNVGLSGVVSSANSLVSTRANGPLGPFIAPLAHGGAVISSSGWGIGSLWSVGAVTFVSGITGAHGVVSSANSLIGSSAQDQIGGVIPLSNGNYLVTSESWDNGSIVNAGFVAWGSGVTGLSGVVSAANSLIGATANDRVGALGKVLVLGSDNFLIRNPDWDNGTAVDAGAVTWGSGSAPTSGVISAVNSVVGSSTNDRVGANGTLLPSGNYVSYSSNWDNGSASNAGAVTWINGAGGVTGVVSAANSVVGSSTDDQVGTFGVSILPSGNFVFNSRDWDNGSATNAGAITWGSGTEGVTGAISAANSLVGTSTNDNVGQASILILSSGNYVTATGSWDNAGLQNVGAVTWGSGTTGVRGVISAANSLVGTRASDGVGSLLTVLDNGHYVVSSGGWDNGSVVNAMALTWVNGTTGLTGPVTPENSLVGLSSSAAPAKVLLDNANDRFFGQFLTESGGHVRVASQSTGVQNNPPQVSLTPITSTLNENTTLSVRLKVADIHVSDDYLGTNALSLSGPDSSVFEIIGTELFLKAETTLNFEVQSTYQVSVDVDDSAVGSSPDDSVSFTMTINDMEEPGAVQAIVPLYQYPLSAPGVLSDWWQRVLDSATVTNPITVIINPSNGPLDPALGGADYNNYVAALTMLRANPHIRILGYVATGYGAASAASIVNLVQRYATGYKHTTSGASLLDGIFLDEMSTDPAHVASYSSVAATIRSMVGLAGDFITGNPGVSVPVQYLNGNTADLFIVREGTLADLLANPTPAYVTDPAFAHLAFGTIVHSTTSAAEVAAAQREMKLRGLDYAFITNDVMSNPFDVAPTYFESFLNDLHAPFAQPATVTIRELPPDVHVHQMVSGDPDAGQSVTYSIVGGNTGDAFQINPTTGEITVKSFGSVDFETTPTFLLQVRVTDNAEPARHDTVTVTIHLTNAAEPPAMTGPITFSFQEFSPRWTLIGRLSAVDPEGDAFTYSIVGGNPDNALYISPSGPDAGKIWVFNPEATSLKQRGSFRLMVRATDNSAEAAYRDTPISILITPATGTQIAPSVDGTVTDTTGNGFDSLDTVTTTAVWNTVRGGNTPGRTVLEFNLPAAPAGRVLTNAWLYFMTPGLLTDRFDINVPIDIYGYNGNGVIEAADATAGTKIGTRPIVNQDAGLAFKVHGAPLDAAFVRARMGSGQLGLVLRNDLTSDGVVVNDVDNSLGAIQKPYLVLQFSDAPADVVVRDVGPTGMGHQFLSLQSNGTSFTVNTADVFPVGSWERFQTGDFNGDGRTDLVGRNTVNGSWWVSLANSSGVHQAATQWGAWSTAATWVDAVVDDFDGDGRDDIAGRVSYGDWWISRSTGSALQATKWGNWSATTTWQNVMSGDFNRDGRADIVGRNSAGQWFVSQSAGTTPATNHWITSQWGLWSSGTTWSDVSVGDFNGDGRDDIIGRSAIGQWWVNRSSGTSFGAAVHYGNWSTGTTWSDVRVADFNGDGRDDIIGRSTIGQWWVAEVGTSGFAMKHMGTRTAPQSQWGEMVVGDFNRDGRADIATRNAATNTVWVSLWTITGNTPSFVTTQWAALPSAGSPQWRLLSSRDPVIDIGSLSVVTTATPSQFAITLVSGVATDQSRDNAVSLALIDSASGRFVLSNGQLRTARAMTVADIGDHTILLRATDSLGGVTNRSLTITIEAPAAASQRIADVGAALLAYHEAFSQFPFDNQTPEFLDANGKPYLSWRVQLLPFIGYGDLYRQFRQNEPWNSPHNFALLNQMPDVYRTRGLATGTNMTGMMMFQGAGAFNIGAGGGPSIANATDGIQHTPLFIETMADNAKFWTQPDDIAFAPANPLGSLVKPSDRFLVGMVDGSVKELNPTVTPANAAALVSWSGHEVLSAPQYQNIYKNWDVKDDAQTSREKLSKLIIALHNQYDSGGIPGWALPYMDGNPNTTGEYGPVLDANGKPFLSWRVFLLPYMGYNELFQKFRPYEPWDSPNNIQLLDEMPEEFRSRGLSPGATTTGFQIPMGSSALTLRVNRSYGFESVVGRNLNNLRDGFENTIALTELPASRAVPWTQWDDIDFNPADPLAEIGPIPSDGLRVAMFDGTLRTVAPTATPASFSRFVTWSDSMNGIEPVFGPTEANNVFLDWPQTDSPASSQLKLKELGLAFHNYHDTYGRFPVTTADGFDGVTPKPYLSWRVHLLPYLGRADLYYQFHLDEPWNSPHNLTLLDKMPEVFRSRGLVSGSHMTSFQVINHETAYRVQVTGGSVPQLNGPRLQDAWDGVSQTFLAIELLSDQAIEWTRPDDIAFDPANPLAGIGAIPIDGLRVLMMDGGVKTINPAVTPDNFKAFVTWRGQEVASHNAVTSNVFLDWQAASTFGTYPAPTTLTEQIATQSREDRLRENQLKVLGLAIHNYHDTFISLPVNGTEWRHFDQTTQASKPNLSWRVHILPYLDESALYNQFHLDEPWDSPHNIQLLDKMPAIFQSRGLSLDSHKTGFQMFRNSGAFQYGPAQSNGYGNWYRRAPKLSDITDGTSSTIGVFETMPENAVDWTNPEGDLFWDPANPFANLVIPPDFFRVLMYDGHVEKLHPSLNSTRFKSLITWNGGELFTL